jgi:hypothetical protein
VSTWAFREVVPLRGGSKLDPQRVGAIIHEIKGKAPPDLPTALWQAARSPRHYLHKCYEWNVQRAAEAHWRDTSQRIMGSIYAVDEETDESQPAFISIVADSGRAYFEPPDIANNLSLQLAVMKAAQRDLMAFQKRYRMLADVCDLIEQAQAKIDAKIAASLPSASAA